MVGGIVKIANVSTYEAKYNHLLSKLRLFGLINSDNKYTGVNPLLEKIYVQPSVKNEEAAIIDFLWISNWLEEKYPNSEFETEFAKALRLWSND